MKAPSHKLRKTLLIIVGVIILVCVLIIAFISPISKYVIEKYSVKIMGRQIKMDWAYVNPFTGNVHFKNIRIYEANGSDSIFISAEGLSAGVSLHKLLKGEYEITSVTLNKPKFTVIQTTRTSFNFSDIIEHFSKPDTTKPPPNSSPTHFSILDVKIKDGTFYFRDTLMGINYFIKDFNFTSEGKRWDADTIPCKFSFSSGIGTGDVSGNFTINTSTLDYKSEIVIKKFSLAIIDQYLKDLTNYGTFRAYLDANVKAKGNFNDPEAIDSKGRFLVYDFHFGKNRAEDYVSFDTLIFAMNEVNPKGHIYHLDSVILNRPYFKFEKYDYLDNVETIFGAKGSNVTAVDQDKTQFNLVIEIAHYLSTLSKNFFASVYKINKLQVNRADFKFNDFSTTEEFSIDADPFFLNADSVDKSKGNFMINLKTGLKPYGYANITAIVNPRDSADFDLNYHMGKIPLTLFNPYLITLTSYPLDRGTIELNGAWQVRKGIISSENDLLMLDPRVTKRVKNDASKWIPLWLVMAFVRQRSNVIDYQIPITGSLKNPKFHLSDIILKTLRNIFVKPVTTPYRFEVRDLEDVIEKSLALKWQTHHTDLTELQQKFMDKMSDFLVKNPNASVTVTPEYYASKEKEYILFFEAKKKYYLINHPEKVNNFSTGDSEDVDKMSVKDSMFVHFLNKKNPHALLFTIQQKCYTIVDSGMVNRQFNLLNAARKNVFMSYFKDKNVADRITFNHGENIIPYNGFSFYKLEYKGEMPDYLSKAYQKIDELNSEEPREKYEKERAKNKSI